MLRTIAMFVVMVGISGAVVAQDCTKKGSGNGSGAKSSPSGIKGEAIRYPLQGIVPVDHKPTPLPIANVEVVARDANSGKEIGRAKTDKDGKYSLPLPQGEYKLEAEYGKDWRYTETVKVGASNWVQLKSQFRYTGKHLPPSAGPQPPAKTSSGIKGEAIRYPLQGIVPVDHKPTPLPIANVEVVARDANSGKEIGRAKTDKDGKYSLPLPQGEYKLEAEYGKDWRYTETVKVGANNWVQLKSQFRYTGNVFPPSAGPRPPAKTSKVEYDVEGKLPQRIDLAVGDVVDFFKVFPGSLKMVYAQSDTKSVLEPQLVLTAPPTPLPTKAVVGRFEAKTAGTAKVTITFEENNGKKSTQDITVTVR